MLRFSKESNMTIYTTYQPRDTCTQLLKTANSNGELVYAIRHFNTFHIGAGVRLLKNEG